MSKASNKEILERIEVLKNKISKNPKDYSSVYQCAAFLQVIGQNDEASDYFIQLANVGAEQIEVYENGSKALIDSGRYNEALMFIAKGQDKFPDSRLLQLRQGMALDKSQDYEGAEVVLKKFYEDQPDRIDAIIALGVFYSNSGHAHKALDILLSGYDKFPDNIAILNNIGAILLNAKEYLQASEYFLKALRIDPTSTQCMINIGSCFEKMHKPEVATQFYEEALKLEPENGVAICAKASLMCNYGLAQEAIPLYEKGLGILRCDPRKAIEFLVNFSNYVFYIHYVPEFSRKKIKESIGTWQKEICIDLDEKPKSSFGNNTDRKRKLKIGLISGSFNVHPVGQMIYSAIENINSDEYEFYMYSDVLPQRRDYLYEKFEKSVSLTRDIYGAASFKVLERIRNDEIDILIEMTGHSDGGKRLPLIAQRVAPVQVKWVGGLFNTTGIQQMDWMITDNIETPEGDDKWYTEKLYRMPDDYIVYHPPFYAPPVTQSPAKANGYVTFGNLNNLAKTNSYSIELWSKILHAVPNSKLLLKGSKMDAEFVQTHIYNAFVQHGIGIDRLIMEGGEKHQDFLNVYNRIDIALDPHPYTGGLTTCEALWMGVPVVTLPGETFAGRHAATHLTNAGMPEWIAQDEQDYIDIAVKWANDLDALAELRAGMREHVSKTPLVDGPRFAKNLEIALRHMWSEWCDEKEAASKPVEVSKPKPKKSKKRK